MMDSTTESSLEFISLTTGKKATNLLEELDRTGPSVALSGRSAQAGLLFSHDQNGRFTAYEVASPCP